MTDVSLVSKFRGSLLGSLVGDCLGSPFEGEAVISPLHLNNYFRQVLDKSLKVPFKPYTDDTAMTKVVAQSLIENKGFNAQHMAKGFANEFFAQPKRCYGSAIADVFFNLRRSNYQDPFGPAKDQFRGLGSYGNGAAMRVAPAALFSFNRNHEDVSDMINLVTDASKITHSNRLGYHGAILQALAIRKALLLNTNDFDPTDFVKELIEQMKQLESSDGIKDPLDEDGSYVPKLETIVKYLSLPEIPPLEEIQKNLGVHVSAFNSVPTAIYCFLAGQKPIDFVEADQTFHRCIHFAISLGGDTDTIASMTGAIAGAHLGDGVIPDQFLVHSEASEEIRKLADELYDISKPELKSNAGEVRAKSESC